MAFSIASGLTPQAGIYCAMITGFLISVLGGSKTQIGGPTGAFVVVVAGIVATHGVDGLFMCTMMAGVLLVILGVTGMGSAVKFIPRPVVIGFTNGIQPPHRLKVVWIVVWRPGKHNKIKGLAERVGFEPTLEFPLNTLSKRAPSATRPSLRCFWEAMPPTGEQGNCGSASSVPSILWR
jgi:hypothetical protein